MTFKALPILYINLGGEMVYILNHRLVAQNIPLNKVARVIGDLLKTMFDQKVMQTMFQPEALYSHSTWKALFDKIAHSSVMKLNATSMNKLYDLMVMSVKYQMVVCKRPQDILLVTLNHLDEVRSIGPRNDVVLDQIFNTVYEQLRIHYSRMSVSSFLLIRSSLLLFFKDSKIRVSLFLKEKLQHNSGAFVLNVSGELPIDYPIPGTIKTFAGDESQPILIKFDCGVRDMKANNKRPSYANVGDRIIQLGLNMYIPNNSSASPSKCQPVTSFGDSAHRYEDHHLDERAKAQIDFLTKLIGVKKSKFGDDGEVGGDRTAAGGDDNSFKFNFDLFDDDDDGGCDGSDAGRASQEQKHVSSSCKSQINTFGIDASKQRNQNAHLQKVLDDMKVLSATDNENIYDLLDDDDDDN